MGKGDTGGKGGGGDNRPYSQLIGHVRLIKGIIHPNFTGCYASMHLRDAPRRQVYALTTDHRMQTLLETALATGYLVDVLAQARSVPSTAPLAGLSGEAFDISQVTLYSQK